MDVLAFFMIGIVVLMALFSATILFFIHEVSEKNKIASIMSIISVLLSIFFSFYVNIFTSDVRGAVAPPTATITITAPDNRLVYTVHVKESVSLEPIVDSQVIIEVDGEVAVIKTTDSKGLSVLVVDSSFAGQTGRLIVESPEYEVYVQDVELTVGGLPEIVELKPEP